MSDKEVLDRMFREVGAMQGILIAFVIAILMLNYGYRVRLASIESRLDIIDGTITIGSPRPTGQ